MNALEEPFVLGGLRLENLNSLSLGDKHLLPDSSGIYIVTSQSLVLYVGKAANLRLRWEHHHRAADCLLFSEPRVSWAEMPTQVLEAMEKRLIEDLKPLLNGERVIARPTGTRAVNIKTRLAQLLTQVLEADPRPEAQVAEALGMTRQRLYQLKTADKVASGEAIAEALERLGYEVVIEIRGK